MGLWRGLTRNLRPLRESAPEGAKGCTTTRIVIATDAVTTASGLQAAVIAPVAAQVMDEKASAPEKPSDRAPAMKSAAWGPPSSMRDAMRLGAIGVITAAST